MSNNPSRHENVQSKCLALAIIPVQLKSLQLPYQSPWDPVGEHMKRLFRGTPISHAKTRIFPLSKDLKSTNFVCPASRGGKRSDLRQRALIYVSRRNDLQDILRRLRDNLSLCVVQYCTNQALAPIVIPHFEGVQAWPGPPPPLTLMQRSDPSIPRPRGSHFEAWLCSLQDTVEIED
jgi:hypothetical protein